MGTDLQVACMDRMCGNRVGELHMMEAELRAVTGKSAVQRKHLSSSAYTAVGFCTVSVVSTASAVHPPNHQDP